MYVYMYIYIVASSLAQWVKNGDTGDPGSISGSGRSPGEGNSNSLQYSCLENRMERGAWQATVHGVAKTRPRLGTHISHTHGCAQHIYHQSSYYFHPRIFIFQLSCRILLKSNHNLQPTSLHQVRILCSIDNAIPTLKRCLGLTEVL